MNAVRSRLGMFAAATLIAANVVVPLLFGDVYPFTSAPMFRDAPQCCANYRVFAPDGRELPPEHWLVQRVYDGNPVGYGVGICPPEILEREFGVPCDEAAILAHIGRQFGKLENRGLDYVEVVEERIGPIDAQRVGIVEIRRWRVARPNAGT
jgi:hypothetical protein